MKRRMRWCALVVLGAVILAGIVSAADLLGEKKITVDFKDMPLADALKVVQQKSGLRLAFAQELIVSAPPVTAKT